MFLHVSWTEGVPQVLFESFAAGLPVVATAVGGVPELAEGRSVLIPPGDADAATEATRRVVSDPELRAELVDAGLECVRRFSLDSEAQRVTALFAGNTQPGALAISVIQRQSWVWAVLPEKAARIDSHGDPALAEVLRDSGYSVTESPGTHAGTAASTPCSTTPTALPGRADLERRAWPSWRRAAWSRSRWPAVA